MNGTAKAREDNRGKAAPARLSLAPTTACLIAASFPGVLAVVLVLGEGAASAQPIHHELPELSNCSFYRSKKEDIPVYSEHDTGSPLVGRLSLGEEVCYIGEEKEFAIVDWSKQAILRTYRVLEPLAESKQAEKTEAPAVPPEGGKDERKDRAYVRMVDLWEPRYPRYTEPGSWLRQLWSNFWSGGVIDDPFAPLRPDDGLGPLPQGGKGSPIPSNSPAPEKKEPGKSL